MRAPKPHAAARLGSLGKRIRGGRVLFGVGGGGLFVLGLLLGVLLGNARLEGVIRVGLDQQLADGGQDGGHLGSGLPLVGLEEADADVAFGVVGDVGVVDAGGEVDFGGGEGVGGGQLDLEAEFAVGVGRGGWAGEGDVPEREVGLVGDVDGYTWDGSLLEVLVLLDGEGRSV